MKTKSIIIGGKQAASLFINNKVIWYKNRYEELEYIESTDGKPYIDLKYKNSIHINVEIKYKFLNFNSSHNHCLIGSDAFELHIMGNGRNDSWFKQGGRYSLYNYVLDKYIVGILKLNYNKVSWNDESINIIEEESLTLYNESSKSITIFKTRDYNLNNNFIGRVYYCKIYDETTGRRFDLIPVRRTFDGVVGLLDKEDNTFYTNEGLGEFLAGPVKEEARYLQVEYLQSNGGQYIGAGFGSSAYKYQTKFQLYTSINSDMKLFGTSGGGLAIINSKYRPVYNRTYNNTDVFVDTLVHDYLVDDKIYVDEVPLSDNIEDYSFVEFVLFGLGGNTLNNYPTAPCRIYEHIVTRKSDNEVVQHLVPAERISDATLGMYDLITDTFLTNNGTGHFTSGDYVRYIK